jgi:FlaA1/EpsC-like NDP-sugar epimerase
LNHLFYKQRLRQMLFILFDVVIVFVSAYFALIMRFTFGVFPLEYQILLVRCLPFDIILTVGVFWFFKLYHSIWAFASVNELVKIFQAVAVVNGLELIYKVFFQFNMPRSFYILNFGFMLILVLLSRLSLRVIYYYKGGKKIDSGAHRKRTMVIGAGAAGSMLINELATYNRGENQVVCIIDDNKEKKGRYLRGIQIIGGREMIQKGVETFTVEEIILAIPSLNQTGIGEILDYCNQTDCRVKILPAITKSLDGKLSRNIRDISYQDLLGRDQVVVNESCISDFHYNKTILVTGGGGSIGSELCRQIVVAKPKVLVIYDIYENNAYDIQVELAQRYPTIRVEAIIGSVRDYPRMRQVFETYRPDLVYHAAAHKHVPLMEVSPNEAIKNNCLGTLNTVRLSDEFRVSNFILISTDKAVRPTNVMGASKRLCEMIIQSYSKESKTKFAAVRFGNVLGSNGSVIPLFLKQIEEGGPITVTHREITRFFMTIPEAVSLVLQAGLYAQGGEIFVLDMGRQVRIYDLAESLIKLKGLKPNVDIPIEIIGLRPGEKLYEEILMDEEGLEKTQNDLIYIGKPIELNEKSFLIQLEGLIEKALSNDSGIKEEVAKLCTTYTVTESR